MTQLLFPLSCLKDRLVSADSKVFQVLCCVFCTVFLRLQMKLSFHMLQTKDEQVMSAGISKLQIFSCTFTQRHKHNNEVGIVLGIVLGALHT